MNYPTPLPDFNETTKKQYEDLLEVAYKYIANLENKIDDLMNEFKYTLEGL